MNSVAPMVLLQVADSRSTVLPSDPQTGFFARPSLPIRRPVRDRHVVDPLGQCAVRFHPALDHLDPVQVGADGVFQGGNEKGGRFSVRCGREITAHGDALAIARVGRLSGLSVRVLELPAAEEPHEHARSRGRIGLATLHGIEQRLPGVLGGPHAGITGRQSLPVQNLQVAEPGEGVLHPVGTGLRAGVFAEEVVVIRGGEGRVAVGGADHAEFVGIGTQLLLDLQTQLKRAPRVLVGQHVILLELAQVQVALVPGAVVGELVVRRKERVSFAIALDLGDFVKRLPLRPGFCVLPGDGLVVHMVDQWKHETVRQVAVVSDGEHVAAGLVLVGLQQRPEIFRIRAALGWIGGGGHGLAGVLGAIPIDDHTMQVLAGWDLRGPLVADERSESAGLVVFLSGRDGLVPGRAVHRPIRPVHHGGPGRYRGKRSR